MASPIFLADVPRFEIKNDMVFIEIDGVCAYCAPLSVLRAAYARVGSLIAYQDAMPSNVLAACRICDQGRAKLAPPGDRH